MTPPQTISDRLVPSVERSTPLYLLLTLGVLACTTEPAPTEPSGEEAALASAEVGYRAVDLGTLPGRRIGGGAEDINDLRHVVGWTRFGPELTRAFLWKNGVMTDLGTLGGAWSRATAVNNADQVVGVSLRSDGQPRAFKWVNGRMVNLGTLGGSYSTATDINNKGHVVGNSFLRGDSGEGYPVIHAFLWRNGAMTDLGTLGGRWSQAMAISDMGHVVGLADVPGGGQHAFLWKDGVMSDLGGTDPSKVFVMAQGVSPNGGRVVGFGQVNTFERHAFLFSKGTVTDLGLFGGRTAFMVDVNDAGRMAGWVDYFESLPRALTRKDGVNTILPRLPGGRTSSARANNKLGDIVGTSDGGTLRVGRPTLWIKQ
jgi:probable HAF family extracellular repeat protein